jgi:hypothetical protein
MFVKALEMGMEYTRFLVSITRYESGIIKSSLGTFFMVNSDGYALTVAHNLATIVEERKQQEQAALDQQTLLEIENKVYHQDLNKNAKEKRRAREALRKTAPDKIIDNIYQWQTDGVKLERYWILDEADLALCKLTGDVLRQAQEFPIFRDADDQLRAGTSLCRLGFASNRINLTYDGTANEGKGLYTISRNVSGQQLLAERYSAQTDSPPSVYPTECIVTREAEHVYPQGSVHFLETSNASLHGQSGGPILDVQGHVCGVQSHNFPYVDGVRDIFYGKEKFRVPEVHDVGVGTHVKTILAYLQLQGVAHRVFRDGEVVEVPARQ